VLADFSLSAMIPFGEKDVDFEVFSLNETEVLSIINGVLQSKRSWSTIIPIEADFGFQLSHETMREHGFLHYIDFWLFDDNVDGKVKCVGRYVKDDRQGDMGCDKWYWYYNGKPPLTFERSMHLPPVYQVSAKKLLCFFDTL
jgi:hypothetical protein